MENQELLRTFHLSKEINGQDILQDINFYIQKGEIITILGLQNTGKSLFVDIISGKENNYKGSIFFEDSLWQNTGIEKNNDKGIFVMNHQSQLNGLMSVAQNLFLFNKRNNNRFLYLPKKNRAIAAAILETFGFEIDPDTIVEKMSYMEQKILYLICIAIQKPKLVIIQDLLFQEDLIKDDRLVVLIKKINRMGASVLFVENKINNAVMMAEYAYIMSSGRLSNRIALSQIESNEVHKLMVGTKQRNE